MILITARFTDGAHNDRAKRRVRTEVRCLHTDLRGHLRVDDRDRGRHVARVDDVGSVGEQRCAAAIDCAINVDAIADRTLLYTRVEIAVHRRIIGEARRDRRRARQHFQKFCRVAAHESKIFDVFGGQDIEARSVFRRDHFAGCFDRDCGISCAHGQRSRWNSERISGVQYDSGGFPGLETFRGDLDSVSARYQRRKGIQPPAIRLDDACDTGRLIGQRYRRPGNYSSRGILYGSRQLSRSLCVGWGYGQKQHRDGYERKNPPTLFHRVVAGLAFALAW